MFDARYLGAALVSVSSFFDVPGMANYSLTLVYLSTDPAADMKSAHILQVFQRNIQSRDVLAELRLVVLQGSQFTDFIQRFHFSNAILYKAAIPTVFKHYEHILLFDCGMIFGWRLNDFIHRLEESICNQEMSLMGAFCYPPNINGALSQDLQAFPHNMLYPSAAVLYFDVKRYNQSAIYERYLNAYAAYREKLRYAEQDLFCLVLKEAELTAFRDDQVLRCHIDMASVDSWSQIAKYEAIYASRDYLYLKHIGSFKPWEKWVLHPAKAIYLREQKRLEKYIGAEGLLALYNSDPYPKNMGFLEQQLIFLERYYESNEGWRIS